MSLRRERKVVTVLFADLAGFTSRAEAMDPEDVAAAF
jgi:class 3 adenylate cyclase